MAERYQPGEKESLWKSRLFKGGVVAAVVGAAFGVWEVAAVGVIAMGGAWALRKAK